MVLRDDQGRGAVDEMIDAPPIADDPYVPERAAGDAGIYPWIAMGVVLLGSYMVILDTTVLGVALPAIADDFRDESGIGIDWVVTAYVMAVGTTTVAAGWLADRFGKRQVFLAALASFTLGSLLCALSPTLPILVAARVFQGIGGGALMPVGMAMVYELFPPDRRGTALGVWGIAVMAAPALGPPLGGWLVSVASWHWIFFVNVPLGLLAIVLGSRLLRDIGFRERRPFDATGLLLAGLSISTIVAAARLAADWGPLDPRTLGLFALGIVLGIALVVRSLRIPSPIMDFRMFTVRTFSVSAVVVGLVAIAQFARLTFLPLELQVVRDLEPDRVGLILAPGAIGVATTMWLGGFLADRIGARTPVMTGLVIVTGGLVYLSRLDQETSISAIVVVLFVSGVGTGLSIMPNTVAAMNSLPSRFVSQASAMRALNRQIARALGTAVLAAIVVAQLGSVAPDATTPSELVEAQSAYNGVFLLAAVLVGVALVLAWFLPDRHLMRHYQDERAAEHDEMMSEAFD